MPLYYYYSNKPSICDAFDHTHVPYISYTLHIIRWVFKPKFIHYTKYAKYAFLLLFSIHQPFVYISDSKTDKEQNLTQNRDLRDSWSVWDRLSSPSITTCCWLLRNAWIQHRVAFLLLYECTYCNFQKSFEWLTSPNALEKSRRIRSVCLPRLEICLQ